MHTVAEAPRANDKDSGPRRSIKAQDVMAGGRWCQNASQARSWLGSHPVWGREASKRGLILDSGFYTGYLEAEKKKSRRI